MRAKLSSSFDRTTALTLKARRTESIGSFNYSGSGDSFVRCFFCMFYPLFNDVGLTEKRKKGKRPCDE